MGKNTAASQNAWKARAYDRVTFLIRKGEKERLKAAAAGQTVNSFIIESLNQRIPGLLSPLDDQSKKKKPRPESERGED